MVLQPSHTLAIAQRGASAETGPHTLLRRHTDAASVTLPGAVLEAEFANDQGTLVLLTEDRPVEEALHLVWLGPQLQIWDHLELSAPYTPGLLRQLTVAGAQQLTFAFFAPDETWCLTVFEGPRLVWTPRRHPVQRHARFGSRSWLDLRQVGAGTSESR
jgi:hypothetical protein